MFMRMPQKNMMRLFVEVTQSGLKRNRELNALLPSMLAISKCQATLLERGVSPQLLPVREVRLIVNYLLT